MDSNVGGTSIDWLDDASIVSVVDHVQSQWQVASRELVPIVHLEKCEYITLQFGARI